MNSVGFYLLASAVSITGVILFAVAFKTQQHEQADANKKIITRLDEDRRSRTETKPLLFSEVGWSAQAGFAVIVTDKSGQRREGIWGFPTTDNEIFRPLRAPQILIVSFVVTNPNPLAAKILSAGMTVHHFEDAKIDVRHGEMVGAGKNRHFQCTLSDQTVRFDGSLVDANVDYITVDANGGLETIQIFVRSDSEGLFEICPNFKYLMGDKTYTVDLSSKRQIAFFKDKPAHYIFPPPGAPEGSVGRLNETDHN